MQNQQQITSKKRRFFEVNKSINVFEKNIGREIKKFVPEKVYPQPTPAVVKQYRDVFDEADDQYEKSSGKNRRLNWKTRKSIIELRYGKYGGMENIDKPVAGTVSVARQLGISYQQVTQTCKVYKANGGFLMLNPWKKHQRRGRLLMTPEIIDYITRKDILREWAHLTLLERCDLIKLRFDVKLHRKTLSWWYKRNGISKTKPQYKFYGALKRKDLAEKQAYFAQRIAYYVDKGYEIIYIDETSTNSWDLSGKVWQYRPDPLHIYRSPDRGCSITVFGALFSKQLHLDFMFARSTNKEDFVRFLQQIESHIKYPRATVLVLDNHRAHHSKVASEFLVNKLWKVLFLPPYSSELNPIELVWSLMKRQWRKELSSYDYQQRMVKLNRTKKEIAEDGQPEESYMVLSSRQKQMMEDAKEVLSKILQELNKVCHLQSLIRHGQNQQGFALIEIAS